MNPIFTINEPQHFSDYGFDSQFDYFQVLEEARKHKRDSSTRSTIDNLHFKLQKPISKDDNKKIKKTRKRWWWKNALHYLKTKCTKKSSYDNNNNNINRYNNVVATPVYLAESRSGSGSATPYHRSSTSRPSSGPLAGTITDIPYISLRELNMDQSHKISASPMPIYLVT